MKQPTFHGRVLLPLSVFAEARAGDLLAMERILRYYDGYINKLCNGTAPETEMSLFFLSMFPLTRWPLGVP